LRVLKGDAGSPLEVGAERRLELRIVWETGLARRLAEKGDPAGTQLFVQTLAGVTREQLAVAAVLAAVNGRAAEHFGEPFRDSLRLVGGGVCEQRRQLRIDRDVLFVQESRHASQRR